MTPLLLATWSATSVLVSIALATSLLPATRSWHRAGLGGVWGLALVGLVASVVTTWAGLTVSEDDLYDAADLAADSLTGVPGEVSQQRLMAEVSAVLGHRVHADRAGSTATETAYDLTPSGAESPVVCVRVQVTTGTPSDLQSSTLLVDRGACS